MDSDAMRQTAYQIRLLAINALFEQALLRTGSEASAESIEELAKMVESAEGGVVPEARADLDDLQAHLLYHALLA